MHILDVAFKHILDTVFMYILDAVVMYIICCIHLYIRLDAIRGSLSGRYPWLAGWFLGVPKDPWGVHGGAWGIPGVPGHPWGSLGVPVVSLVDRKRSWASLFTKYFIHVCCFPAARIIRWCNQCLTQITMCSKLVAARSLRSHWAVGPAKVKNLWSLLVARIWHAVRPVPDFIHSDSSRGGCKLGRGK